MLSNELLGTFREEVADLADPPLWSPALIYTYIDEAQKMFCRLTDGIADSSSPAAELELEPGEAWVSVHSSVLQIRNVWGADGKEVTILPVERMEQEGIHLDDRVGRPRVLISGMEEQRLRVWPIPTEGATYKMSVFRLPVCAITGPRQTLEIRAEHHHALLSWVKHLAYGKQDSDTYDPQASAKFEGAFRLYCDGVKKEQARLRRTPQPVAYGGY